MVSGFGMANAPYAPVSVVAFELKLLIGVPSIWKLFPYWSPPFTEIIVLPLPREVALLTLELAPADRPSRLV